MNPNFGMFIKQPFVIKIFLSVFEWPFYTLSLQLSLWFLNPVWATNLDKMSMVNFWMLPMVIFTLVVCVLRLYAPANNYSVMSGQFPVFLR